jgi:hypothetical protein
VRQYTEGEKMGAKNRNWEESEKYGIRNKKGRMEQMFKIEFN